MLYLPGICNTDQKDNSYLVKQAPITIWFTLTQVSMLVESDVLVLKRDVYSKIGHILTRTFEFEVPCLGPDLSLPGFLLVGVWVRVDRLFLPTS